MLLPRSCPICQRPGSAPCAACVTRLRRAPRLRAPPGLDACFALFEYEGGAKHLVTALKYRRARALVPWLACQLATLAPERVEVVTWAPTTRRRKRVRGFDQAQALARRVALGLERPVVATLRRGAGRSQTGRGRADRLGEGPRFTARRPVTGSVLLVDDVITTGATLSAASRELRSAGASAVAAVVVARTPQPWARSIPVPYDQRIGDENRRRLTEWM